MAAQLSSAKQQLLAKMLRGAVSMRSLEITRRSSGVEFPLSYGQQQIWLHSQLSADSFIYNEPVTIHRTGPLDLQVLEKSFTEIVRRHEAWRTTFQWKNGDLVQVVGPAPAHIEIPSVDLSELIFAEAIDTANDLATRDALEPFDLNRGPMYRLRLVHLSKDYSRLYLCLHHIIFDGVSLYQVFLPEMQALYESFSAGLPSPLAELPLQYGDYAIWQRKRVDQIEPAQMIYWQKKLTNLPVTDMLPPDRARGPVQTYHGAMETLALSANVTNALKALGQGEGVTLFATLLGSFHVLLWVYTRESDIILGTSSAGRNLSETVTMLGFFLNVVVLRTNLSGDPTLVELIHRCFDELLDTLSHDVVPFEHLVKEICPKHNGNKNPLFQVLISFEPPLAPLLQGWDFSQMDVETKLAKFDLHLELDERKEGIIGRFVYNCDLFEKATILEMMKTWDRILERIIEDPSCHLSQLPSLLPEHNRTPFATHIANIPVNLPPAVDMPEIPEASKRKGFIRQILGAFAERNI